MSTKKSIDSILEELHFLPSEKEAFKECIRLVKEEQLTGEINAEPLMLDIIKEVIKDEI